MVSSHREQEISHLGDENPAYPSTKDKKTLHLVDKVRHQSLVQKTLLRLRTPINENPHFEYTQPSELDWEISNTGHLRSPLLRHLHPRLQASPCSCHHHHHRAHPHHHHHYLSTPPPILPFLHRVKPTGCGRGTLPVIYFSSSDNNNCYTLF